ncbi:MAG: Ig-like domain-containing protein [Gemmatimonadota bacterium]
MTRIRSATWAYLLLLFGVAALSACSDSVSPELRGAVVRIYLGGTAYDEQTVAVDSVFKLDASILNTAGKVVDGETVEWSSDRPEVASVDAAGVVTARAIGTAHIIARHAVGEDTALINVAEGFTRNELPACSPSDELQLGVGEIQLVAGAEALPVCLPGGEAGAEYTMVAVNTGTTAASVLDLLVRANGLAQTDAAQRVLSDARGPAGPSTTELDAAGRFHQRLRHDVSRRLEPRLRAGIPAVALGGPRAQVSLGGLRSFNVETSSSDGCSDPQMRTGRIRAIGERAIVVADTLNPQGGFTDEDYREFAEFFDDDAWPLVTQNFGEPSDLDESGKIYIFFTRAVNELPANAGGGGSYTGGFFFNRDLFPTSSCAGSNGAEMFYMLVPNPSPPAGEREFSRQFVSRSTRTVLVHEFQHLVNDSRRLHVSKSPVWEETWMNEGLSHIAEELMFYRRSGRQPRENLGPEDLESAGVRDAFRLFQQDNVERLTAFLRGPEYVSLMGPDILATRGATWSFLRYAADRKGGDETVLWHTLVRDSRTAGLDGLRTALADDPATWIRDWAAALYLDDTGLDSENRHRVQSWDMRALYPVLGTLFSGAINQPYPLRVSRLFSFGATPLPLKGGSAGYLRTVVDPDELGAVYFLTGGQRGQSYLPAPARMKVVIVRTR